MGSAARFTRCTALLLLLGAAFATVPGRPTVMDVRLNRITPKVSVAAIGGTAEQESYGSKYDSYGTEEKEFCLTEISRKGCHTHVEKSSCESGKQAAAGTGGQHSEHHCDPVHSFWTSDLACCQDKQDAGYGYGSKSSGSVGDRLWGPAPQPIGSCDWTWHWVHHGYHADLIIAADSYSGDSIYKLGSATAICFFGADSHTCGGPFCERMVMSLEGNVYFVSRVYSYWGPAQTTTSHQCHFHNYYHAAAGPGAGDGSSAYAAGSKDAAAATDGQVSASIQGYGGDDYRATYQGKAVVANGIINSMAGPHKEKWDSGLFETVLSYHQTIGGPVLGPLDPNVPWVRDKTYKFTFFKEGKSGYKDLSY